MAATSKVSICNQALSWLGANLITSLSDDSVEAKVCAANYDALLAATLEAAVWTFATKRKVLIPVMDTPSWGYTYQFLIPSDAIRILYVGRSDNVTESDPVEDWQVEGNYIMANVSKMYVRYTSNVTDPLLYSPCFVQTFASRLASDIAVSITNSRTMMSDMWGLYQTKLNEAASLDALQGRTRLIRSTELSQRRRLGAATSLG